MIELERWMKQIEFLDFDIHRCKVSSKAQTKKVETNGRIGRLMAKNRQADRLLFVTKTSVHQRKNSPLKKSVIPKVQRVHCAAAQKGVKKKKSAEPFTRCRADRHTTFILNILPMTLLTDALTAYLTPLLKKHAAGEPLIWEDLEASLAASNDVMKNSSNTFVSVRDPWTLFLPDSEVRTVLYQTSFPSAT